MLGDVLVQTIHNILERYIAISLGLRQHGNGNAFYKKAIRAAILTDRPQLQGYCHSMQQSLHTQVHTHPLTM